MYLLDQYRGIVLLSLCTPVTPCTCRFTDPTGGGSQGRCRRHRYETSDAAGRHDECNFQVSLVDPVKESQLNATYKMALYRRARRL